MATDADPVVGNWYRHLDKGQKFEVVAVDEDQGSVEVQHFDGDVEEIDIDTWYQMEIENIEAPENWSGPVDSFEEETLDYTETDMDEGEWEAPASDYEASGGRRKGRRAPVDAEKPEEASGDDEQGFADDDLWRDKE